MLFGCSRLVTEDSSAVLRLAELPAMRGQKATGSHTRKVRVATISTGFLKFDDSIRFALFNISSPAKRLQLLLRICLAATKVLCSFVSRHSDEMI